MTWDNKCKVLNLLPGTSHLSHPIAVVYFLFFLLAIGSMRALITGLIKYLEKGCLGDPVC